jgi:hypothetical protein
MFRDAPLFAWFNASRVRSFGTTAGRKAESEAPSPLPAFSMSKLISASGLAR